LKKKRVLKIALKFVGVAISMASLSTIWWGEYTGYGSSARVLIPVLFVLIGASVLYEYIYDKPLILGLITVPVDASRFREIILLVAIFLMIMPLLIALGMYR
tara:strand:- start:2572 stop:2877 length:306 start_codon:yes stop_codon:yes gene_type:complete